MKFTLDKKILTGFVICALILFIVAIVSFRNSEKFIEANQWVNHTHEVLSEFDQVLISSVDAETGARGFVITGIDSYLEPFSAAKSDFFEHIERVRLLTKDNPVQQTNINRIEQLANDRLAHLEECISLRRMDFGKAQALVATGKGKAIQDEIRKFVRSAKDLEQKLLEDRKRNSDEDARNFSLVFIALILIITLVLIAVYFIISSNLKALKKAEAETADKNWTLGGSGELVKGMQGNKTIGEIAQVIISHLSTYLNAQVGALYIVGADNTSLQLAGSYAMSKGDLNAEAIQFGQGLVGQAAAEKRNILISDIPAGRFNLTTGFGEALPKNIIALPFVFEDSVIGVIELGSIHGFTLLQTNYLQIVSDSIAIAVTSSQAREKTKQLLEETQQQAEELEAQQQELKQSNEELHAKTELLERSEQELKAQQDELKQANEELGEKANMLEEQKDKLETAKGQIEIKVKEIEITSKYKSEFLANMSHELRTPLNSILILSQLLSENKHKSLEAKDIEFAKNIHSSGTDLLNLINEILDLSKVEAGKMQLDIGEVVAQDVIANMSSLFTEVAKSKSLNFNIEVNKELRSTTIISDGQRLEQILKNLLSNAFKFTGSGGTVSLTVARSNSWKTFKNNYLNAGEIISFTIADTGIGISKDKQEVIFEAFQQADGSTKRKYGGTGLGLSISRELANVLGGEIHLASEEGKGSSFTLYLPIKFNPDFIPVNEKGVEVKEKKITRSPQPWTIDPEISEIITDDDRNVIQHNDRVILIVEDEKEFAKVLLDFVREHHYKGIIASNGNTGLIYARHYKPDAILLDVKLPIMDGVDVLKQLKNDTGLRHIPVQIISAYDKKKETLALGAFDYLTKPATISDLNKALDRIRKFTEKHLKKLLIVEDNELQNKAIKELIGNGDVKSFSAFSGSEAYRLLTTEVFDCVIVDLGLPDMTGFELLEKIKANDLLNKIPIIVYTGRDLKKDENNRLTKLADTVVLKTANSHERLLDETILFLHRVESKLPKEKQILIRKLHRTDEVLKNKKILIVDDDMRNIYSLTNVLEDEGIRCVIAETGKAAIQTLKNEPSIELILMDIMMPEMDGYEATREIRKMEQFNKLPIIALTAKAMKGDKEKCLAAGMSDYISKPVNIDQLLSLLRVWLYK